MKIGIITFHRAHNYGAVLQCYALQEFFKRDNIVSIINYTPPKIENLYKVFSIDLFFYFLNNKKYKSLIGYTAHFYKRFLRKNKFINFERKFLNVTEPVKGKKEIPNDYDAYIVGSDQVWNLNLTGSDDFYFAGYNNNIPVFGYAISSNENSIEQIGGKNICDIVSHFHLLSFREENICNKISSYTGVDYPVTLDPTLLFDSSFWDKLCEDNKRKKYILLYQVRYPKEGKNILREKAGYIAKQKKCGVIEIKWGNYDYGPTEFLSLFKHAEFVITSSFHGTVFALIFQKKINVYGLNDGMDGRCISLLEKMGIKDKVYRDLYQNPTDYECDYEMIEEKLAKMRKSSILYLNSVCSNG